MTQHIAIIGNGIAGITAARHIRKLCNHRITVISGESDHFFSRTALMYIYMGQMKFENTKPYEDWFWSKNKIELKKAWVKSIEPASKRILFTEGEDLPYDQLILATGSKSNRFDWPGQDLDGVQGLYSLQDLALMEKNTSGIDRAVIVGGGLIGVEMAEMLHSRHIPVTYLVREKHFGGGILPHEEGNIIDDHLRLQGIDLRLDTGLSVILDNGNGKVQGVKTDSGELIDCQFVGLAVGVHPNLGLAKDSEIETDRGILVNEYLETSIPGIYAIGDCAQLRHPLPHRKAIEPVWYTGRMMGETVARTITGTKTKYRPGVWFNSAKFFDIEYQNYGEVPVIKRPGWDKFYWEGPDRKQCIKIAFEKENLTVKGVNLLGIRHRHELWDKWIKESKPLDYVIQHLPKANFDPEFYKHWEGEIQNKFNAEYSEHRVRHF